MATNDNTLFLAHVDDLFTILNRSSDDQLEDRFFL